tara:strand:- start:200 stop:1819 length:1620 start_codon:yes stop_codon:yes gene_type:complete
MKRLKNVLIISVLVIVGIVVILSSFNILLSPRFAEEDSLITFQDRYPEIYDDLIERQREADDVDIVDVPYTTPEPLGGGVRCGGIIEEDVVLTRNYQCFDEPGFILAPGSGGLTLDCNNHVIEADEYWPGIGGYVGIEVVRGSGKVIIKNCNIRFFWQGVRADGGDLKDIGGFVLEDSQVSFNTDRGVHVKEIKDGGVLIRNNDVHDNDVDGIFVADSDNAVIFNNDLTNNKHGLTVYKSRNAQITENEAYVNKENGFKIWEGSSARIWNNIAEATDRDGRYIKHGHGFNIKLSSNVELRENQAVDNDVDGFYVSGSPSTNLKENLARGNGMYGYYLGGSGFSFLEDNKAARNGVTGYFVYVSSGSRMVLSDPDLDYSVDGLHIVGSEDLLIKDLELSDTVVVTGGSNNLVFEGNTFNSGGNGLEIIPGDANDKMNGILIKDNLFYSGEFGSFVEGLHTIDLKNNKFRGNKGSYVKGVNVLSQFTDNDFCTDGVDFDCEYFQGDLEDNICNDVNTNQCAIKKCSRGCGGVSIPQPLRAE